MRRNDPRPFRPVAFLRVRVSTHHFVMCCGRDTSAYRLLQTHREDPGDMQPDT
jgi:hypothetical protein